MMTHNIDDFEYSCGVNLNYTEAEIDGKKKPVYHFVYASQLYGTIFGIYAKFEPDPEYKGKNYAIKTISFKLINYKGSINIGLTGNYEWDDENTTLYFGLRGASVTTEDKFKFDLPF